jgi:NIPSNAP
VIVELREYHIYTGKLPEYLRIYEEEGLPIQVPILGNLIGFFTTEVGALSSIVHLWGYESLAERERRRAELQAHEGWKAYLAKVQPLIHTQQNRILVPTSFSPIR